VTRVFIKISELPPNIEFGCVRSPVKTVFQRQLQENGFNSFFFIFFHLRNFSFRTGLKLTLFLDLQNQRWARGFSASGEGVRHPTSSVQRFSQF